MEHEDITANEGPSILEILEERTADDITAADDPEPEHEPVPEETPVTPPAKKARVTATPPRRPETKELSSKVARALNAQQFPRVKAAETSLIKKAQFKAAALTGSRHITYRRTVENAGKKQGKAVTALTAPEEAKVWQLADQAQFQIAAAEKRQAKAEAAALRWKAEALEYQLQAKNSQAALHQAVTQLEAARASHYLHAGIGLSSPFAAPPVVLPAFSPARKPHHKFVERRLAAKAAKAAAKQSAE